MAKYSGTILGHYVVAELSDLTGSYYVEIDGVKKATGAQYVADRPVVLDLDGHRMIVRFSGIAMGHIEIVLDGKVLYSA